MLDNSSWVRLQGKKMAKASGNFCKVDASAMLMYAILTLIAMGLVEF
jgi:hypothetical protein